MTVLVCFDTQTREVRRYDSRRSFGITHEGGLPDVDDAAYQLRLFRDNPPTSTERPAYSAWMRWMPRDEPWRPR